MKHIQTLDGIRGIAILAVLAFHSRPAFAMTAELPFLCFRVLALGWTGVDLFFVLSGFLITGILLDSRHSPEYFRTFYARRILRIFPLYFTYLFLVFALARPAWQWYAGEDLWRSAGPGWYLTYLMNWKPDSGSGDYLLGHLWSLAVEEQFYLVWPFLIWLLPRRRLTWLCAVLIAGAFGLRCWMSSLGVSSDVIYRMTPCRVDCLAAGALVAILLRDSPDRLMRWAPQVLAFCGASFAVVAAFSLNPVWSDLSMRTVGATLLALGFGGAVYRAATLRSGWFHRFLSSPLLRQFGKFSYGIYILHGAVMEITIPFVRDLSNSSLPQPWILAMKYAYFPALAAVSFGLARLSWKYLEEPFLALKSRFRYGDAVRSQHSIPASLPRYS